MKPNLSRKEILMSLISTNILLALPQTVNEWKLVVLTAVITSAIFIFLILVKFYGFIKEQQFINDQYVKKMSEQYEKTTETS